MELINGCIGRTILIKIFLIAVSLLNESFRLFLTFVEHMSSDKIWGELK